MKLDDVKKNIEEYIDRHLADRSELFLVDVQIKGHEGSRKVTVLLDGDQGVNIDECAALSRGLSNELDEKEWIKGKYTLEVSSPGVDMPLTMVRQYLKNLNRMVKVKLIDGTVITGKLLKAGQDSIRIDKEIKVKNKVDFEEEEISFQNIDQTNVLVTF